MLLAAEIIDVDALLNVVWVSFAATVGGTAAFSVSIRGATRFVDLRREGRDLEAGVFAVLTGLALAICLGGMALGLYAIVKT
jgi:hypothetical protein